MRVILPARGNAFVHNWRDATGLTFSRKAGDTIEEAIPFKAKIDAELNVGTFVAQCSPARGG